VEFLVIEETVGYGACLKTDSYNPWYLELIPLTHHIVAQCAAWDDAADGSSRLLCRLAALGT